MTASKTVTLTLTASEAWFLAQCCADSASKWHELWQDTACGKRLDLDLNACRLLNRQAWGFYEKLHAVMDAAA